MIQAQMHLEFFASCLPQPSLFIHGNLASNQWWYPTMGQLRSGRHSNPALLAEWGGCGWSVSLPSTAQDGIQGLARQYTHLLESSGLQPPFDIVAHSTGCLIALHMAVQAPHLLRKMVLLDPVSPRGLELSPDMRAAFDQMAVDRDFCREVMRSTVDPQQLPELFEQYVETAFRSVDHLRHWIPEALAQGSLPVPCESISHEILVLHGEQDPILSLEEAQRLAQQLPRGRFQLLAGRGHSMNVEDPSGFATILLDFLRA